MSTSIPFRAIAVTAIALVLLGAPPVRGQPPTSSQHSFSSGLDAIPEPATMSLLIVAGGALATRALARRRRRDAAV